ncbi:hypothetical protein B566_EDAN014853 [Ephemera danica]|nr:hypothetical protein B566_EDAN014853 [Ephemera danica]
MMMMMPKMMMTRRAMMLRKRRRRKRSAKRSVLQPRNQIMPVMKNTAQLVVPKKAKEAKRAKGRAKRREVTVIMIPMKIGTKAVALRQPQQRRPLLGKRGGGGYTRAYTLSPELAAVVGQDSMARHEVVRKIWSIIKERNLYDPKNKQFAICDDELLKVFGVKRFRTFGMMKYLKNHFID